MIDRLVPASVATAEARADILDIDLFPAEERSLGRAVEKRRREFVTGRACARSALKRLGVAPTAIANGPHGEPLWPPGIVGSITHCRGYRACAVARASELTSLGIDAEVDGPLPDGVLEQVAFGSERAFAESGGREHRGTLLFSAKEAVFKAWFPLAGRWLGFEDARVEVDLDAHTFCAELLVPGPAVHGVPLTGFRGAWCVEAGVICSAVVVER